MNKKVKQTIFEYIIPLIILLAVIILFYVPTKYDIDSDGGLINLYNRIEVDPSYNMEGSINITYVGGKRGTIINLLLSKIIPSWDAYPASDSRIEGETYKEQLARGKVELKEAQNNATYVALTTAGYDVKIKSYEVTVIYIYNEATTSLKVGDIINDVDGIEILKSSELTDLIQSKQPGDTLKINVTRNKKDLTVDATIYYDEEYKRNMIGIIINPVVELDYDDITINFKNESNEYGPSGGLMNALLIYNKLTEDDITNGDIISGTGTIDLDGTVGRIAGVKYKLRGAYKNGAKVFIVPKDNYDEALKIKEENNMDIELIMADDFNTVVNVLKMRKK